MIARAERNAAIYWERVRTGATFRALGKKHGVTGQRVREIFDRIGRERREHYRRINARQFFSEFPALGEFVKTRYANHVQYLDVFLEDADRLADRMFGKQAAHDSLPSTP